MTVRARYSLKSRLLWYVMAAIALTAAFQVYMAFQTTIHETDELFDYQMQQVAFSLRPATQGAGLSAAGMRMDNDNDEDDEFVIQIWAPNDVQPFHSNDQTRLLTRTPEGFSSIQLQGKLFRVFALVSGDHLIQVAQEVGIRDRMAGKLALRTVAPMLATVPLLLFLVWRGVSVAFAPMARITSQLANRRGNQLQSLSSEGLSREVAPFVEEVNRHYERVRHTLESQRLFLADAAHELRSPIAALTLQLEVLNRTLETAQQDKAAQNLKAGISRAARVVEQMLAWENQQSAQTESRQRGPVDLTSVVKRTLQEIQDQAAAKHIEIKHHLAVGQFVEGDFEMLSILVRNIVDNAIRYTPENGVIQVAIERRAQGLVLGVQDNGPGIPAGCLARVFDRFYRVPGSVGNGSGLGLAIVREIATFHHASVVMDPASEAGGLNLQVTFPLPDSPNQSSRGPGD